MRGPPRDEQAASVYRAPSAAQRLTEAQALALAQVEVGYALETHGTEYAWGWMFNPAPPVAYGPGPVSVSHQGRVVAGGSDPFSTGYCEECGPYEASEYRRPSWLAIVRRMVTGVHGRKDKCPVCGARSARQP